MTCGVADEFGDHEANTPATLGRKHNIDNIEGQQNAPFLKCSLREGLANPPDMNGEVCCVSDWRRH
jgi:hypothetical protein